MECNGHDAPFRDKSNVVDALPSPEASPLPDLPPRRHSLVGLKGIMASRKSWWENQLTNSAGQSGGNPMSQSMPCLNLGESRTCSRSSVSPRKLASKFGRKFSDDQENAEVSSKNVADTKPLKLAQQGADQGANKDNSAKALDPSNSTVHSTSATLTAAEFAEHPTLADEQLQKDDFAAGAVQHIEEVEECAQEQTEAEAGPLSPRQPTGSSIAHEAPAQDSRTVTPNPKQPEQPYWKRFTNVWKRTPMCEKKQVDKAPVEASLCVAGSSPTPATTSKPTVTVSSLDGIVDEQPVEQPSPADGNGNSVASPAQDMQSPTSVESLSPNYGEARESEPRRCSEVKMMTLQCMSENIQDMTTYSAGQDIDVSLDGTFEKASAQQRSDGKMEEEGFPDHQSAELHKAPTPADTATGAGAAETEANAEHYAHMEVEDTETSRKQNELSIHEITSNAHLSPNSKQVVLSPDCEEAPIPDTNSVPGSFAVDVSLDEPALAPCIDTTMTEAGAVVSAGSPVASDSPKDVPPPSVNDSFSFGGPATKQVADTRIDEQVVASLAQLPFGGLASHNQQQPELDSATADFTLPRMSEEPTLFTSGENSRMLHETTNLVSVSLADGCGADIKAAEVPATAAAPVSSLDSKAENPSTVASVLPPRHPSPPPVAHGPVAPLVVRPDLPPAKEIGIREAVEQIVQSSPKARQRQISPGGSRRGMGRCGDSIPLFVKDLPTENLLDDTNMEEWLSPSKEPPKNFNNLLDETIALGAGTDIEKVFEGLQQLEAAGQQCSIPMHSGEQHAPAAVQQSPRQDKEREVLKMQQAASSQPSLVRHSSAQKSPPAASASKQPASSPMRSPRTAAVAPNKSPRGAPSTTSKLLRTASQAHSLRSPRGLPTASASAAANTSTAPSSMKSPRKPLPTQSATKSPQATANKTSTAPKSARGTGITSLMQKTAHSAGVQAVPTKTPRGTAISSIPKVAQRSSNLPSAPTTTPRGTATSLPSARGTGVSRLNGAKPTPRGTLPSAPAKTPREAPAASGMGSNRPNLVSSNRSPSKPKEPESTPRGTTPPRQATLKRPLSSPVSAHRLRTGRPQPVTPRMDKTADVHMVDAQPAASMTESEAGAGAQCTAAKPAKAAVPLLNLNRLAAAPAENTEQEKEQIAADMEVCNQVDPSVQTDALPDASKDQLLDTAKTPAAAQKGALEVNATSLEAWTPELYMPAAATPAAVMAMTNGKGLSVYNANLQATPFQMLPKVPLDAAVNAPLIDSSPLCWDEDFGNDTQKIIMQLATSPAPTNLGTPNVSSSNDKAPQHSPAPNSLVQMQVQMLLQQVSEFKTKVQQLEADKLALKDHISTMQFGRDFEKEGDDFEKEARLYAESELQKVQAQNVQLTARVQSLEQEQLGSSKERAELQKSVQQLSEANITFESERNSALDQVGLMEVELTALRSALTEVRQQLGEEQKQVAELNALLAKERDERVKLIKENHDSKRDLKKLMEQLISAQTEQQVANKEVEKANALVDKLRQEKDAEVVKVAQLTSHLEHSKAEAKELMAMCSELLALQEGAAGGRGPTTLTS